MSSPVAPSWSLRDKHCFSKKATVGWCPLGRRINTPSQNTSRPSRQLRHQPRFTVATRPERLDAEFALGCQTPKVNRFGQSREDPVRGTNKAKESIEKGPGIGPSVSTSAEK